MARPGWMDLRPGGIGFYGWLLSSIYFTSIFDDARSTDSASGTSSAITTNGVTSNAPAAIPRNFNLPFIALSPFWTAIS
jgi:hypothetical protein